MNDFYYPSSLYGAVVVVLVVIIVVLYMAMDSAQARLQRMRPLLEELESEKERISKELSKVAAERDEARADIEKVRKVWEMSAVNKELHRELKSVAQQSNNIADYAEMIKSERDQLAADLEKAKSDGAVWTGQLQQSRQQFDQLAAEKQLIKEDRDAARKTCAKWADKSIALAAEKAKWGDKCVALAAENEEIRAKLATLYPPGGPRACSKHHTPGPISCPQCYPNWRILCTEHAEVNGRLAAEKAALETRVVEVTQDSEQYFKDNKRLLAEKDALVDEIVALKLLKSPSHIQAEERLVALERERDEALLAQSAAVERAEKTYELLTAAEAERDTALAQLKEEREQLEIHSGFSNILEADSQRLCVYCNLPEGEHRSAGANCPVQVAKRGETTEWRGTIYTPQGTRLAAALAELQLLKGGEATCIANTESSEPSAQPAKTSSTQNKTL